MNSITALLSIVGIVISLIGITFFEQPMHLYILLPLLRRKQFRLALHLKYPEIHPILLSPIVRS